MENKASIIIRLESQNTTFLPEIAEIMAGIESVLRDLFAQYQTQAKEKDIVLSIVTDRDLWVGTEQYIYGQICEVGGKEQTHIQIQTQEYGLLFVQTNKTQSQYAGTLLYQEVCLYVKATQHLDNGRLKDCELIGFEPYQPNRPVEELRKQLNENVIEVNPAWANKTIDEFLDEMRKDDW